MAALRAVVFDFGDTLMRFRYDRDTHLRALAAMLAELGAPAAAAEPIAAELELRLGPALEVRTDQVEVDYLALMRDSLEAAGVDVELDRLRQALRAEHRCWDDSCELHPDAVALLDGVQARGLRVGLVSNAIDLAELMHEDLELLGLAGRIDAAVFSSELGVRKPHPAIYLHVLGRLGVAPEHALFVGDRVREDVSGPAALGMRTCLARYYRNDGGDQRLADYRIDAPLELLSILDHSFVPRG